MTVGKIPAIIATIGTLAIFRACCSRSRPEQNVLAFELPDSLPRPRGEEAARPAPARLDRARSRARRRLPALVAVGAGFLRGGGSNPDAARYAGIPVGRRVFTASISGALAGLGGFMFAARFASVDAVAGTNLELDAVTWSSIGGVNIFGGSGRCSAILGAVLVATMQDGFTLLKLSEFWKIFFNGTAIVVAVTIDALVTHRLQEALRRRRREMVAAREQAPPQEAVLTRFARSLLVRWETVLVLLIIAVGLWCRSLSPLFLTKLNLLDLATPYIFIGLMALGLTFVVIAGEIDISVASILAVSVVILGQVYEAGANIWFAALVGLLVATGLGLLNGFRRGRRSALARGHARDAGRLPRARVPHPQRRRVATFPTRFTNIGIGYVWGQQVPIALLVFLGTAIALGFLLHATRFGRYIYAIGSNREAARYSGIPVTRVRMAVFGISGLLAGVSGLVYVGYFGSSRADAADGSLLDVVTAVVLGGVDIFGGSGSILGVVLAVILIAELRNGMLLDNIGGDTQNIVIGCLLLGAILAGNAIRALQASGLRQRIARARTKEVVRPKGSGGGRREARAIDARHTNQEVKGNASLQIEGAARPRGRRRARRGALGGAGARGRTRRRPGCGEGRELQDLPDPEVHRDPGLHAQRQGWQGSRQEARRHRHVRRPDGGVGGEAGAVHRHAVRQGYNAVISANDPNAVAPALKRAQARGLKVVSSTTPTRRRTLAPSTSARPIRTRSGPGRSSGSARRSATGARSRSSRRRRRRRIRTRGSP